MFQDPEGTRYAWARTTEVTGSGRPGHGLHPRRSGQAARPRPRPAGCLRPASLGWSGRIGRAPEPPRVHTGYIRRCRRAGTAPRGGQNQPLSGRPPSTGRPVTAVRRHRRTPGPEVTRMEHRWSPRPRRAGCASRCDPTSCSRISTCPPPAKVPGTWAAQHRQDNEPTHRPMQGGNDADRVDQRLRGRLDQAEGFSTETLGFQVKPQRPDCDTERWLSVVPPPTSRGWRWCWTC
jgi:hypothetical protein